MLLCNPVFTALEKSIQIVTKTGVFSNKLMD